MLLSIMCTLFAGVRLNILGRAKVGFAHNQNKDSTGRVDYKAEEIYINEQAYVLTSCQSVLCTI